MTLMEALEQVELEPGQIYECWVRGRLVQVVVASTSDPVAEDSDSMWTAWCDLGDPVSRWRSQIRLTSLPLPERAEILDDEVAPE